MQNAAKRPKKRFRKSFPNTYSGARRSLACLSLSTAATSQKIDLEFIEWLGENGVPFAIIFTKADKLGTTKLRENVQNYLKKLEEQWEELPPHFVTSSEKKLGRQEVLDYIESINQTL